MHDNMDYTPYEGRKVTGWPRVVLSRGRVIVEDECLTAERGSGTFLERQPTPLEKVRAPAGTPLDPSTIFNADLM